MIEPGNNDSQMKKGNVLEPARISGLGISTLEIAPVALNYKEHQIGPWCVRMVQRHAAIHTSFNLKASSLRPALERTANSPQGGQTALYGITYQL